MIRAQASVVIDRPVEAVFRFVAVDFFRNYPRWSPEVRELRATTPGPIRVGSAGRQVRIDYGRRTESLFRVSELDAPHRVAFQGVSSPYRVSYQLDPRGAATRLTFTFELQRLELFMLPLERLIRRGVQDSAERMVGRLKGLLESESPVGGA
jgi:hypothetical protein